MEHDRPFPDYPMPESGLQEFKATRGEAQPEGAPVASEELVIDALRTVYDPEIPVNIYDLGLIYVCDIDARGNVRIEMTLTAPGCPVAGQMPDWVADAVSGVPGTGEVSVTITWDPPWTMDRMTEDAKMALGMF
jgi:FeS assembly SUF system protein